MVPIQCKIVCPLAVGSIAKISQAPTQAGLSLTLYLKYPAGGDRVPPPPHADRVLYI